ncbi:DUF6714 family protein [Chloroflexota bacterium]
MNKNELRKLIEHTFAEVPYPGDNNLRNSNEGVEPFLLEEEFKGKDDWKSLSPNFIDQAPDGFSSALSFFSKEAFRFYLPAYLMADMDGKLVYTDIVFYLTYGLTDSTKDIPVNPKRYGSFTWFEYVSERFAVLTREQAETIRLYLKRKLGEPDLVYEREGIEQALHNYWEKAAN